MSIPDYQTIMLPLLEYASDGKEHASREPVVPLTVRFALSVEEQQTLVPSGKPMFADRVAWALSYLRSAGLLQSTRRGYFRITERGLSLLNTRPARVDNRLLAQYPEFQEFLERSRRSTSGAPADADRNGKQAASSLVEEAVQQRQTPSELLEEAYQAIRQGLAQDLLERIKQCTPAFFERLVVELLVAMGYGGSRKDAGEAVGRSGDEGIDGIIKEDRLGLDIIYIQAKRWERTVGVQMFISSLARLQGSMRKKVYLSRRQTSVEKHSSLWPALKRRLS